MIDYDLAEAQKVMQSKALGLSRTIFYVSDSANLPLHAACALIEKESGGHNVYGHDAGGALSGYPDQVDESNFRVFRWLIKFDHHVSNGVGPAQITFPGFFDQMEKEGLKPWVARDNMFFAFRLLAGYKASHHTWTAAGTAYNGSPIYGADLAARVSKWKDALVPAVVTP